MASVTCVLMGVAEVKVPLQRLPREVRIQVANASHWAVLYCDRNDGDKPKDGISRSDSEEPKQNSHEPKDIKNKHSISNDESNKDYRKDIDLSRESEKFIGEVDNFYGLREVEVRCEENQCQITHGDDTVMQHRTRDVIVAMSVKQLRVVYVTRCSSYSRAAVVLQMRTQQDIQQLLSLFPHAVIDPLRPDADSSEMPTRDYKASWSREMGKKFSAMLTSITAPVALQARKSPMMTRKIFNTPAEPCTESSAPQSDHSSDSDSDEDDVVDEVDGKSSGEYYKEIGLDASVQERLYDNATDTDSRSSNSSLESSLSVIEAELKFFFDTDRDFLKCLSSLPDDRQRLSRDQTPQFIRENLTLLFAQVKSLTLLHTKLHSEFETCCNDLQKLSETIVRHQSEYEYYVYFMENIPTVDRILQTHKDYFKQHVPDMPEKLRKPRMRLHYYVLTLETLHKRSSNADDKNALQNAITILKRVLKKADSKLFLGAVDGAPFDLTNFGTLIRHSDLALRRGPGDLPRRVYHVLMLKDLLLLTSRNGMNYRYVTSFRMDQVGPGKYERGILFNLEVRNGPRGQVVHYTFKAKNINMQQLWIKDLEANLKEKICPNTTPRNSLIETDFDARHSSKTRGRQAQLINKATDRSVSQESQNDLEVVVDSRAVRTDNNNSTWTGSGRRAAMKKTSTVSTKNRPVVRQQSGYTSDGAEGGINKWKFSDRLPYLTLWSHFPYLKVLCEQQTKPSGIEGTPRALIHSLLVEETKYIDDLVKTLGLKLEEDLPQPPTCLVFQVRHLYEFHTEVFQPLLQKSATTGDKIEVAQCFVDCSDALKPHYSRYLADLSQFYNELLENNLLNHYKLPVEQLKQYIVTLSVLQREDEEVIPPLQMALSILRECISTANTILLTEMIEGAPFPLEEQGPVLYEGPAKVRWTGIPIRQDFHVVLLETMILLLESHPPTYRYVDSLRMDTVGLGPPSDGYSFMLEVRTAATKTQTYVFKTPSQTAKKDWLNEITRVLTLQVDRLKEKQKRRFGNDKRELKVLEGDDPDKYKFPVPAARRRPDNTEQCQDNPDKKALETHM
ncbi:hypothetical protein Pcinc_005974 [Petrolisthes cinctipes]|uniref:Uncharacterized protein n=1 Tax=Petrolisthes cinctipes TaxID=88211 RepID=A0AAE1GE30_PETCI|nr:hypothetical protein Pcinc_005974 [Petrolisthes cinctipes]